MFILYAKHEKAIKTRRMETYIYLSFWTGANIDQLLAKPTFHSRYAHTLSWTGKGSMYTVASRANNVDSDQTAPMIQEQSDQGLHCLPFRQHYLDTLLCSKSTMFNINFQSDYSKFSGAINKTNKWRAPSEDSDQPGHAPSLIRVFAVCSKVSHDDPRFLHADSKDSDQTGRMTRLMVDQLQLNQYSVPATLTLHDSSRKIAMDRWTQSHLVP